MGDAQIWTVISVFAAVMLGVFGYLVKLSGAIGGLQATVVALVQRVEESEVRTAARFDASEVRFTDAIAAAEARTDAKFEALSGKLSRAISAAEARTNAKIDALGERIRRQAEVTDARFDTVDHRLHAIEDDMRLVKGHLLGQKSA